MPSVAGLFLSRILDVLTDGPGSEYIDDPESLAAALANRALVDRDIDVGLQCLRVLFLLVLRY